MTLGGWAFRNPVDPRMELRGGVGLKIGMSIAITESGNKTMGGRDSTSVWDLLGTWFSPSELKHLTSS